MNCPRKLLYAIMFVFTLLFLNSCVMDDFDTCFETSELKTFGYMPLHINTGSNATRAIGNDYNVGIEDEVDLSPEANHYAIFYTEAGGMPIAVANISSQSEDKSENDKANSSIVLATIAAKTEEPELILKFAECFVVLNTDIEYEKIWATTRSELFGKVVDSPYFIDKNGKKFLTMSNSVYVNNGTRTIHTEIDPSRIYKSYQEAIEQAWKGIAAVNVYLERLSAKFSLVFDNEVFNEENAIIEYPINEDMIVFNGINQNGIPYYTLGPDPFNPSAGKYSYRVRLTGWGMNALERKTYLFRNFNANGNYFTDWYNTVNKRVFWSEDLNYKNDIYPFQFRKVIDNTGIPVYETKYDKNNKEKDGNILLNKSYYELNKNGFTAKYQYTPENTYDIKDKSFSSSLENRIEYLAGTHMIICAEVHHNLENVNVWKAGDLFRDRNNNFYKSERDVFEALLSAMNQVLNSHSSLKYTYYDWDKGGVEMKLFAKTHGPCGIYLGNTRLTPENFESVIKNYGGQLTTEAEFKGSDGKRIIWNDNMKILDSDGQPLWIYSNIDDVFPENDVKLREANINDFKSLIFEHVGAVDHFKDGKMYYAVPIGYIQNPNSSASNQIYDAYGVVRNSEYEIKVNGVRGLGTPVDNDMDPIIPNGNGTNDQLYLGLKILNWHLFEETVPGGF